MDNLVREKPVFKPKQNIIENVQDLFPVLLTYARESNTCVKAFGKIREEVVEFGNARMGTVHEVEELLDIMGACATYLLTHCKEPTIKEGYKQYIDKHKERYKEAGIAK